MNYLAESIFKSCPSCWTTEAYEDLIDYEYGSQITLRTEHCDNKESMLTVITNQPVNILIL